MDWKGTLGSIVPGIANMLGGPLAGMAANAVMGFFGIESTGDKAADEAALARAVESMTPEQAVELRKVEANLAAELKKADVDIFKAEVDDRKSARRAYVELGGDWIAKILALLFVGCYGYVNYSIFNDPIINANKDIILRSLGTLDGILLSVVSFYFGGMFKSKK